MIEQTEPTVVVVNFGSSQLLRENLAPLSRADAAVSVVVVDNWSGSDERRAVRRLAEEHRWLLVAPSSNLGFGAGMNRGVAAAIDAGAQTFTLLNPDASISAEALRQLQHRSVEHPMALISALVLRPDGSVWFDGGTLDMARGRPRRGIPATGSGDLQWLSGACLSTSAELWGRLGGFDEDYFLYWEDVDLSVRAARLGAELVVADDVVAVHDEGGTQDRPDGTGEHSSTYYYFNIRNRSLFAAKNLDAGTRRRWARHALAEAYQVMLRGGGRRKFLQPWRPLGVAGRALLDAHRP